MSTQIVTRKLTGTFIGSCGLFFFALALLATSAIAGSVPVGMKIFFVEFGVAPYESITKDNIERFANYELWFYGQHKFISDISGTLEKEKSRLPMDNSNIRLKAVVFRKSGDIIYYVDRNGVVLRQDTGEGFLLQNIEKEHLQEAIFLYRGVVDQKPSIDQWGEYRE